MEHKTLVVQRASPIPVMSRCYLAIGFFERLRGLLGRGSLDANEGMFFENTNSVHMWGMRFPIDIVFLKKVDLSYQVVRIVTDAAPWTVFPFGCWQATDVLEAQAGWSKKVSLIPSEVLCFES